MTDASASAAARRLAERAGYDPAFLGVEVPMPTLTSPEPTVLLRYLHYSVLFRPGPADNDLDQGHLVMRASSTWGDTEDEARQAGVDTFDFTNAAPQNKLFNRGRTLWLGLEAHLKDHAARFDRKLAVLAGPVLDPADPPYRGIQVPLRFWKVVAFRQDGALAATGYLLDQSPLVDDLGAALEERVPGAPPPLGPFRTFQVPVADIAALAGVVLDPLVAADVLQSALTGAEPPPGQPSGAWVALSSLDDVVLSR